MFQTGLVSVSFRKLTPQEIIAAAAQVNLNWIEWGSDIHAPYDDPARLEEIARLQQESGIGCCAYGTYFRLGVHAPEELPGYIRAAKCLGTGTLRLWCGDRSPAKYAPEELDALYAQCRRVAKIAEAAGVTLCMECHNWTLTETAESALALMEAVDSPAFRMYYQPNQFKSTEENLRYAQLLSPYTENIHVFHWLGDDKFPLAQGLEFWEAYLSCFTGHHKLLLEFMPDGRIESLPAEAAALMKLTGETL